MAATDLTMVRRLPVEGSGVFAWAVAARESASTSGLRQRGRILQTDEAILISATQQGIGGIGQRGAVIEGEAHILRVRHQRNQAILCCRLTE